SLACETAWRLCTVICESLREKNACTNPWSRYVSAYGTGSGGGPRLNRTRPRRRRHQCATVSAPDTIGLARAAIAGSAITNCPSNQVEPVYERYRFITTLRWRMSRLNQGEPRDDFSSGHGIVKGQAQWKRKRRLDGARGDAAWFAAAARPVNLRARSKRESSTRPARSFSIAVSAAPASMKSPRSPAPESRRSMRDSPARKRCSRP